MCKTSVNVAEVFDFLFHLFGNTNDYSEKNCIKKKK